MMTRRALVAAVALLAGCTRANKYDAGVKRYVLRGEVKSLDAKEQVATIKHEKIDGWMEAMTMEFPIRDKAEFAKLAPGKRIRATVHVKDLDYWLTDIQAE